MKQHPSDAESFAADERRIPGVTHAQRVAFADAMMEPPTCMGPDCTNTIEDDSRFCSDECRQTGREEYKRYGRDDDER